ncbi:hypothetical protein BDZ85DRAFT_269085 [Elsinoe ampelina]|uniref:Uncharacterized protein n=1 Tax=Elsinoe ampelina TaxID=302913 RepID=A0A6A6G0P1_9PEZI|nr:hypothetical protein BDZ85DRAFT_269085 [Elsinoe ampelina]
MQPSSEDDGPESFRYSFNNDMVYFVQRDSEADLEHGLKGPGEPEGSEDENSGPFGSRINQQKDWLAKNSTLVGRNKIPWIIVAGHRPLHISATNMTSTVHHGCQNAFESLFLNTLSILHCPDLSTPTNGMFLCTITRSTRKS